MVNSGAVNLGRSDCMFQDREIWINIRDDVSGREIANEYETLRDLVSVSQPKYKRNITDKLLGRKGECYYLAPDLRVKGAFQTEGLAEAPAEIRDEGQKISNVSIDSDPETPDTITVLIKDGMKEPTEHGDVFVSNEVVKVKYTEHNGYIIREFINSLDSDATFHHRPYNTPVDYVYGKKGAVVKIDEASQQIVAKKELPDGEIPEASDFFDSFLELAAQPGNSLD